MAAKVVELKPHAAGSHFPRVWGEAAKEHNSYRGNQRKEVERGLPDAKHLDPALPEALIPDLSSYSFLDPSQVELDFYHL